MVISDKFKTEIQYHVYYGPNKMDERNIKTFGDINAAVEFFKSKESSMSVDVFMVTTEIREIREKLT